MLEWRTEGKGGSVIQFANTTASLRDQLRARTSHAHERLDGAMSTFGWDTRAGYARFLQVQHAARLPIERWIGEKCPKNLQTPAQADLLEADIAALGLTIFTPPRAFKLAAGAEPTGAVWALAGSSLGNAMILKSLMQSADAASLPTAFLSDTSMHAFWRNLLPALMRVPDQALADASCEGAQAVFDHFLRTAQAFQQRLAA